MLLAPERTTTLDAVARLVGLQAQAPRPPFLGLWTRLERFRRDDLVGLLTARKVVRVTAMRATLHLMTTADYVALRAALQPGLTRGRNAVLGVRSKGLDLAALEALARAFFGKAPATFDAFRAHLKTAYPKQDERAMAYAVRTSLPLVQVPTDAPWGFPAASDFALADGWIRKPVPVTAAPADVLVRRYLSSFGPATTADAQVWSGLPALREVFERLRPSLVTFRDAGNRELFDLPDAPRPDGETPAPPRFLPEFDNLVLSHADRTRVVADEHRSRIVLKNLQVRATFLVDGFVAGTWKIQRVKKSAVLIVEPFRPLARRTVGELQAEGARLLAFAEGDAGRQDVQVLRAG
jgi:hypothetical protein